MTVEASDTAVVKFRDDDEGYLGWVSQNPGGWVLNKDTAERPLKLHRASCDTISTPSLPRTTNGLTKFCSTDRDALVTYARASPSSRSAAPPAALTADAPRLTLATGNADLRTMSARCSSADCGTCSSRCADREGRMA